MNAKEKITYDIVDGPNRDSLIDAFKYAYEVKIPVRFVLAKNGIRENSRVVQNISVYGVQHEAGTGHHFNLEGCLDYLPSEESRYLRLKFSAFYNSETRIGHIEITRG